MKVKLVSGIMVFMLVMSLSACTAATKETTVQVSYDDFTQDNHLTREINTRAGNTIKVTVASNPTTGFKWELAGISDEAVLEQDEEPEYVPPEGKTESAPPEGTAIGAGGQEIWTFEALKKGTSVISMEYSRPWEGGEKGWWTLDISVKVR